MNLLHIHAPKATAKAAIATVCLDCKKRTRMLDFFTPWYGWHSTCIRCGREWNDGEWANLDFVRGIREKNIDAAKKLWRAMPRLSENHFGLDRDIN